jgi:hypothetical protein
LPEEISDWMYVDNGRLVGGTTVRVLRNSASEEEGAEFDQSVPFVIADDVDPERPLTRLLDAVGHEDLAVLSRVLRDHPKLKNRRGVVCIVCLLGGMERESMCALEYAAHLGRTASARILLEAGAKPNIAAAFRNRPLHMAAMYGHVDVARLLVKHGADIDARNRRGRTALLIACSNDHVPCALALLELGADVRLGDRESGAGVMHEVRDVGLARRLLEAGAPRDLPAKDGDTPLHYAVINGFIDVAVFLIERGAPLDVTNEDGKTPLDIAREPDGLEEKDRLRIERAVQARERR